MKILSFVLITLSLSFLSCHRDPARQISNSGELKVSLKYLVKNYKSLHGQKIETEGTVYFQFENVAICTPERLFSRERDCFWLDFNEDSNFNYSILKTNSGKTLTLTGVVDTTSKGHLNSYLATLRYVDFPDLTNVRTIKLTKNTLDGKQ